ncbi:hypothetical protein MYX64_04530 [Nitrospinae bacterium AH_259_B05_G02_I21]|nr:hypothetical protein [Nitrospinae bacterium AH_259_B05_G02_I21]
MVVGKKKNHGGEDGEDSISRKPIRKRAEERGIDEVEAETDRIVSKGIQPEEMINYRIAKPGNRPKRCKGPK